MDTRILQQVLTSDGIHFFLIPEASAFPSLVCLYNPLFQELGIIIDT